MTSESGLFPPPFGRFLPFILVVSVGASHMWRLAEEFIIVTVSLLSLFFSGHFRVTVIGIFAAMSRSGTTTRYAFFKRPPQCRLPYVFSFFR